MVPLLVGFHVCFLMELRSLDFLVHWVLPDFQLECHSSLNIGIAHFVQQVVFVIDWPFLEVDLVMMSEWLRRVVGIP